jgi:serine/threonine protein kinase
MRLSNFIQCGSFNKVYSAKNTVTKEKVAIKVIAVNDLKDALSKDILRSEMTVIK